MFCKKKGGNAVDTVVFAALCSNIYLMILSMGGGGDTESSGLPHMPDGTWAGWGDFNVPWRTCSHGQPRKTWGWTFLELAHMVGAFWKVRGWGGSSVPWTCANGWCWDDFNFHWTCWHVPCYRRQGVAGVILTFLELAHIVDAAEHMVERISLVLVPLTSLFHVLWNQLVYGAFLTKTWSRFCMPLQLQRTKRCFRKWERNENWSMWQRRRCRSKVIRQAPATCTKVQCHWFCKCCPCNKKGYPKLKPCRRLHQN